MLTCRPRSFLPLLLMLSTWGRAADPKPVGGAEKSSWYMYFGDHPVSERWGIHLEGQFRRQGIGQRWEQLVVRPGVNYNFGHGFTAMLAYTYLRGYPFEGGSLGKATTTGPQPEHRIHQELKYKHKLVGSGETTINLTHRFRAEQRWQGTSTAYVGTTDWKFAERARYRLTANIPLRWSTAGVLPDYISVYDEVFVNFGPHGGSHALNQNRAYGALGWNLGPKCQVEAGYLEQYMPAPNGILDEHNHAFQLTVSSTAPFRRGLRRR